jgi:hypothetical protein
MNYNEWEIRVRRTMMAMEDLAVDLNIAMEEIEKWEKEGKVPKKAIKHLQWLEKDSDFIEEEQQPTPTWVENFQKKLKAHNKKISDKKSNKNIKTKK